MQGHGNCYRIFRFIFNRRFLLSLVWRKGVSVKRICIAGASECGKTTLAIELSRAYWRDKGIATLALDPWGHNWGKQAWTTSDEETFFGKWDDKKKKFDESGVIWKRRGDLVIVDEGSSTIARDRELIPLFTKIRHQEHTLIVICHDATDLLPTMRRMLNELFLFLQTSKSVETWQQDLPGMKGLEQATTLGRFEFVHCENFSGAVKQKLPKP